MSAVRDVAADETDELWAALSSRDPASDGSFVYSVATTGIYCKPSCSSRMPLRRNVRFHATPEDAERAGFRPCKRCRPDRLSPVDAGALRVERACRLIETADTEPSLADLAAHAGMSPQYFHRVFKSIVGVTPKAYAVARRASRMREELKGSGSVTEAIYAAGFNSSGRFYEAANGVLGTTPTRYRAGGAGLALRYTLGESFLGHVLVAASEKGVCAILLGDDPEALRRELRLQYPRATLTGGDADFAATAAEVIASVEDPGRACNLPLDIQGTAFQHRVWEALRKIPLGQTASYSEIAAAIGEPKAVRAVARACASNRLAVVVPCHRVVRTGGALSGYRWGVERKRKLLEREAKG